jgi:hypothetical protein
LKFGFTLSIEQANLPGAQKGPDVALIAEDTGNIAGPLHVAVCAGFVQVVVQVSWLLVREKFVAKNPWTGLPNLLTTMLPGCAPSQGVAEHNVDPYGTAEPVIASMVGKLERLPTPARRTVLPLPKMSQATPTRGLKFVFWG